VLSLVKFASRKFQLRGLVVAVTLAFGTGCHRGASSALVELDEARALAAELRVQFTKSADASNRAVMADTDEASIGFANDARQATQAVDSDVAALTPVLQSLGFPDELHTVEQFKTHFAEYRELDGRILALAVENTNLKAQQLSFGPARTAADGFRDALGTLVTGTASKNRCRVEVLAADAVLDVREIQVLQAPHIAEADDAAMTRMEKQMADLETKARDALRELSGLAAPEGSAGVSAAHAALDQFASASRQLVALSRKNTNVLSLDLSLRAKPPLTAACDDTLRALEDALAKEGDKATR
jgi:hypothetical protein